MKKWSVYMLRCRGGALYTGATTDVSRRVHEHQQGKGAKYTKANAPVELVFSKCVGTESEAKKEEARIKKMSRSQKLTFIRS